MALTFADVVANYRKQRAARPAPVAAPAGPEGRITLQGNLIRVAWDRGAQGFNAYLGEARRLKTAIPGSRGYDGQGGWLFQPSGLSAILAAFPAFEVAPEVHDKGGAVRQVEVKPADARKGWVEQRGGQLFVGWSSCATTDFQRYLASCRAVKDQHGGRYSKPDNGWWFPLSAAADLADHFGNFDIAAEVNALAHSRPADEDGPDEEAERLARAADEVLAGW